VGRPRTPIGTFGIIATRTHPSGNHVAKARYRDWDGMNRLVHATGPSRYAAERKLKQKLAERSLYQPGFNGMSADSPFPELVAYWLEDISSAVSSSCPSASQGCRGCLLQPAVTVWWRLFIIKKR